MLSELTMTEVRKYLAPIYFPLKFKWLPLQLGLTFTGRTILSGTSRCSRLLQTSEEEGFTVEENNQGYKGFQRISKDN
jgi:hypothetical protein